MLVWRKHLESEQADTDDVIAEDEGTEDIRVLAVLLCGLFVARAARHQLHNVQDLIEELQGCVELFVGYLIYLAFGITLLYAPSVKRTIEVVERGKLQ